MKECHEKITKGGINIWEIGYWSTDVEEDNDSSAEENEDEEEEYYDS